MTVQMDDFAEKVAVVTGGASGIGKALAQALAKQGSRVVIADVEAAVLELAQKEISAACDIDVHAVVTDVSNVESVQSLADEVFDEFGEVNILVNNAGVGAPSAKVWETTPNDWRWIFNVNLYGVVYGILCFVPRMLESGKPGYVINTSSGDGAVTPMPAASVYASSKAAVTTVTECLAAQLRDEGAPIGVSLFLPGGKGLLDTGLWTADRNRPDELARERPRTTAPMTVAQLRESAAKAGKEIPIQPLDELAESVLEGMRKGVYCIDFRLESSADTLRERADRFGRGEIPLGVSHSLMG
ncbi:MAG: SDR family NAD(P)-dependent oxidoreductase [Acidimicrobiales bacterium]